jgi:hypothetical protein
MESNSTILEPINSTHQNGGLYVRFFQKELSLSLAELGGPQFVEDRVSDFIYETITKEWGFPAQYNSAVEEDTEKLGSNVKIVRIRVSSERGKITEAMAKLEAHIGYTHDENSSMKSRFGANSTTPFDPNAIRIEYVGPGMSEPLTDFGFNHDYRGNNLFGYGRSTYFINLRFPDGYFDLQEDETDDELVKAGNWHLKSLGESIQYLRSIEEKIPMVSFSKSTIPTIYATGTYREQLLGIIQSGCLPVVGGEFPIVQVELPSGNYYRYNYKDVDRYETQNGEEIDVLWAEIHRNDEAITPRFLHLSYEIIDFLMDQVESAKGDSDSLKAVLYNSDGETIRCFMKLQVWAP